MEVYEKTMHISIHAPRVGSDQAINAEFDALHEFQSTLPVWGATFTYDYDGRTVSDFNPRSPCGERPVGQGKPPHELSDFNPRSPCGERRIM